MWFHIALSEGFFPSDAERLDLCLSDTYYMDHVDRIPHEPTQHFHGGSHPGEEYESDLEDWSECSSSESAMESADAEES